MKALVTSLWHETRGHFRRLPVWLPGTPMALGDVGVFDDDGWTRHTTLADLGVRVRSQKSPEPVDYNYSSTQGAEVSTSVAAATDPTLAGVATGNAVLRVRFSRSGAFVLRADGVRIHRMTNLAEVDEQILALFEAGTWRREWVFVSEVARGGPVLTLVSNSTDGEVVVDLGVAAAVPVADARAGFRIGRERGLAATFASTGETSVLWRGRRVRDPWFGAPRLVDRGADDSRDARWAGPTAESDPVDREPYLFDVEHPDDLIN